MERLITAGELKNWAYCPRVVFYRRHLPQTWRETFKMREALRAQDLVERLEARRSLATYGIEGYERRFGLWLSNAELGITEKLDLALVGSGEAIPVDFKLTSGEIADNHRMQLAAYGVLLEASLGVRVARGLLYRVSDGELFEVRLDEVWRDRLKAAVAEIRQMDADELLPEATVVRKRCEDCEYGNFCGDVW